MHSFSLNKNERLKGKKNIETLFLEGKAFFVEPYKIIYTYTATRKSTEAPVLMGVAISKKNMKLAVHRNYIKRITKEAFRTQKIPLYTHCINIENVQLHVLFLYQKKEKPEYSSIELSIKQAIEKLIKKISNP